MEWIWIALLAILIVMAGLLFIKISFCFQLKIMPSDKRLTLVAYFGILPIYRKNLNFQELVDDETEWSKIEQKAENLLQKNRTDTKRRNKIPINQLTEMRRAVTVHKMECVTRIGTGAASSTGSVTGVLMAIAAILEQIFHQWFLLKKPVQFRVEPAFQIKCFHVLADGIFSFRLGKAIYVWLRYVNRKPGKTR